MKHILNKLALVGGLAFALGSCDVLDRTPLDQISPKAYYNSDTQLASFTIAKYGHFANVAGSWGPGIASWDNGSDNQAGVSGNRKYFTREAWKVPESGELGFNSIRDINYFITEVEPKVKDGKVGGNPTEINHYLGEAYFLRAYLYFGKLTTYGDYPIVTEPLPDQEAVLQEKAKRQPRNEVARFILKDLDKAIELLKTTTPMNQRISKRVAQLFKSRVALFEATFQKYHAGSGRVPGDAQWPGKDKEWNKGKTFDQAAEVRFFLEQAVASAKLVADAVELTPNNHVLNPTTAYNGWNPYYDMFASQNLASVPEVLLWRQYSATANLVHHTSQRLSEGTASGWTRSLVESFLTKEGLPYYAAGTRSDATIKEVKANRDERLQLFIFAEEDPLKMNNNQVEKLFEQAAMLESNETKDVTGYRQRKFYNYNPAMRNNTQVDETATIVFRAAEAYLNYIEASYLLHNNLTAEAKAYWEKLRVRAGINPNTIDATIAATQMAVEANVNRDSYDWGAFSGGQPIDATLYSIRRERRCELAGEGYRWNDLLRWRAMDQVKNYQIEGCNFWDKIHEYDYFKKDDPNNAGQKLNETRIVATGADGSQLSSKSLSKYIRPYQILKANNEMYDGYTFYQAYYLHPFSVQEILFCSPTRNVEDSHLYQTVGWEAVPNTSSLY